MLAKLNMSGDVSSSQQCPPSEPLEIQQIIEPRRASVTQILAYTPASNSARNCIPSNESRRRYQGQCVVRRGADDQSFDTWCHNRRNVDSGIPRCLAASLWLSPFAFSSCTANHFLLASTTPGGVMTFGTVGRGISASPRASASASDDRRTSRIERFSWDATVSASSVTGSIFSADAR